MKAGSFITRPEARPRAQKGRDERESEQQGTEQQQHHGLGQGPKHPTFDPAQRENGDISADDHQHPDQHQFAHLTDGLRDDGQAGDSAAFRQGRQLAGHILHHDDGVVHHHAEIDRPESQEAAHDAKGRHGPETQGKRKEQETGDNACRAPAPEEKEQHRDYQATRQDQIAPHGVNHPINQFGTVIERQQLHVRWQTGLGVSQGKPEGPRHRARVFPSSIMAVPNTAS